MCVIIISHIRFRVNLHSIVAWVPRNSLLETGTISEVSDIETSNVLPVSSKEFLDIQATIECRFTLKWVRDMIITYSQMHRTDKYSQHSSIIWPFWLNGWVFIYELSGCGYEFRCYHFSVVFWEVNITFESILKVYPVPAMILHTKQPPTLTKRKVMFFGEPITNTCMLF